MVPLKPDAPQDVPGVPGERRAEDGSGFCAAGFCPHTGENALAIHGDLGQLVWERRIPAVEEQKLSVSLREAGAAAGVYTVSVRSASGMAATRVVLTD